MIARLDRAERELAEANSQVGETMSVLRQQREEAAIESAYIIICGFSGDAFKANMHRQAVCEAARIIMREMFQIPDAQMQRDYEGTENQARLEALYDVRKAGK